MRRLRHWTRRVTTRASRRGHATGIILMYHRIGTGGPDPWQLAVTPAHFAEHLAVLKRRAHPAPLGRLVADAFDRTLVNRTVAVTFDDGYADNLLAAKPLLDAADVPATVYVTTGSTGTSQEFWWDELERLLLLPARLPDHLALAIEGHALHWTLGPAVDGGWTTTSPPSDARLRFHHDVWSAVRALPSVERSTALADLRRWGGAPVPPRETHRVMTAAELHAIEERGLIEIGGHTVSHPYLPDLSASGQREEIATSLETLETILGHRIRSFSYPFGGATGDTVRIARELGVGEAVGVQEESVWHPSDRFLLPRFAVRDWDGDEFERRFRRWLAWHAAE